MRGALLLFFAAAAVAAPQSVDFDARLTAEAVRLESELAAIDVAAFPKELKPALEESGKRLAETRVIEEPLVRLYRLREPFVDIETLAFLAQHKSAADSLQAVHALVDARRTAGGASPATPRGSALQRALEQIAVNRAEKILDAALPYAKVGSPLAGVYYVGEAEANRKFAAFVATLPFPPDKHVRPDVAAVNAALTSLDAAALTFFEKDPAGRSAMGPSARLKEARELTNRGWTEGAALSLLDAQRTIKAALPVRTAAPDDSIAKLWTAVDRDGLPLYASLFAPAPAAKKVPASVTVTLVRWPYT